MAGETLGLIDTGAKLLGIGEDRVVPIFVAQHFRDIFAPARIARHRRIEQQLVGGVETSLPVIGFLSASTLAE